jgi:outer membrane protein
MFMCIFQLLSSYAKGKRMNIKTATAAILHILIIIFFPSCVSDKVNEKGIVRNYQRSLSNQGPQKRIDTNGEDLQRPLDLLRPSSEQKSGLPSIEIIKDPNTGKTTALLTIEQAIGRTLANSPEIRVVSFDPSIARLEVTQAASEFDITAFSSVNFEQEDNPVNSIFTAGQSNTRALESGIKQKGITGSEWSLSYALSRNWDDLVGRTLATRYEPILAFEIKQPLLRDAWQKVNLAGVDLAKLNYQVTLLGFRQKADDISTEVISAYWRLVQARRDLEIQQSLLGRTLETLNKVEGRSEIDATDVQIKQTEASLKAREATLILAKRNVADAQDVLLRLMADPKINMLDNIEILPVTTPSTQLNKLDISDILSLAIRKNPVVQQARVGIVIADINYRVADNEDMPRLDLVASARMQDIARHPNTAHDRLDDGNYVSYAIGLTLEYPFGNRQREAELFKRKLERRKAISVLQNVADQVALQGKERIRTVETNHEEIQVQKEAADAATVQLQTLEDSEEIRERLTPEFLLVKLQAQEALANAQRAEIRAIIEFNISLAQLAQTTGTVLGLHQIQPLLSAISEQTTESVPAQP